jgi:excisionase family DNA binding protein
MPSTALKTHSVDPEERALIKGVFELLSSVKQSAGGSVKFVLESQSGRQKTVVVSDKLLDAMRDLTDLMQGGQQVSLFADDPEITPEKASDLLGISRPTVVQRIKKGELKAHMAGTHHRILMSDLIAFRRRELEKAEAEHEARSNAARFAIANNAIEGIHASPETEELLETWARGDIDDDELMETALRKYGPGV